MIVTQAINVHLDKPTTPTIETVQSDTGRAVQASLFLQGKIWKAPAGATGMVRHSILHDGEVYTSAYDTLSDGRLAVEFSGSLMTVHLTPEILSIPGVGELQVGILDGDVLVATMSVLLRVQRNIGTQGLKPTAYTDLSHHIQNELVRQFRDIYDQGSWLENLHNRIEADFAPGGIDQNGEFDPDRASCITSRFIFHGGREVSVAFPAGIKVRCVFYDADYVYRGETTHFTQSFTRHYPFTYLRLEASYEDDGRIQDYGLIEQIGVFYDGIYQGHIGALENKSFRVCNQAGYYRFTAQDLENLSDAPDIRTGGVLEVLPHGDTNVVFQKLWTSDGQLWFRKGSSPFRQVTSGVFTVTYTDNEDEYQRIDKTFDEIKAAFDAGMVVQCRYFEQILPLTAQTDGDFLFSFMGNSSSLSECGIWVSIRQDGSAEADYTDKYYPEFGQNLSAVRYFRLHYRDGQWLVREGLNGWLQPCIDGEPAKCVLTGDSSDFDIHLPLVEVDPDGLVFTFSHTCSGKRYTARLTVVDSSDLEGIPAAEVLIEDAGYTKAETDAAIDKAIAKIDFPEGGGAPWRLAKAVTLEEDVGEIVLSADDDGNPLCCKEALLYAHTPAAGVCEGYLVVGGNEGDDSPQIATSYLTNSGAETRYCVHISLLDSFLYVQSTSSNTSVNTVQTVKAFGKPLDLGEINYIRLRADGRPLIKTGTVVKLYVRG